MHERELNDTPSSTRSDVGGQLNLDGGTYVVPREFTNYDLNAFTWRNGSAADVFESAATQLTKELQAKRVLRNP